MKNTRKKKGESQEVAQVLLPILGILATVKGALYELVINSGMSVLLALLEQEREKLCGVRCQHDAGRAAPLQTHHHTIGAPTRKSTFPNDLSAAT